MAPIEDLGFDAACASLDPAAFKQAVYSFGGPFSKAPLRRLVRERARIYALLAEGGLPRPRRVEDSLADFCHAALQLLHDTQA